MWQKILVNAGLLGLPAFGRWVGRKIRARRVRKGRRLLLSDDKLLALYRMADKAQRERLEPYLRRRGLIK